MPRIKYLRTSSPPPPPPVRMDYVEDLIGRHMRERKLSYARLAPMVGLTKSGAEHKKTRGGEKFELGELFAWCRVLGVSPDALAEAVRLAYAGK